MLKAVFTYLALAIAGVVLIDFAVAYLRATSKGLQRLIDAGRGSATIVAAQLGAIAAGLVAASDKITSWITTIAGAPGAEDQIKTAIQSYCTPTTVGAALLAFTLIVAACRARTLKA